MLNNVPEAQRLLDFLQSNPRYLAYFNSYTGLGVPPKGGLVTQAQAQALINIVLGPDKYGQAFSLGNLRAAYGRVDELIDYTTRTSSVGSFNVLFGILINPNANFGFTPAIFDTITDPRYDFQKVKDGLALLTDLNQRNLTAAFQRVNGFSISFGSGFFSSSAQLSPTERTAFFQILNPKPGVTYSEAEYIEMLTLVDTVNKESTDAAFNYVNGFSLLYRSGSSALTPDQQQALFDVLHPAAPYKYVLRDYLNNIKEIYELQRAITSDLREPFKILFGYELPADKITDPVLREVLFSLVATKANPATGTFDYQRSEIVKALTLAKAITDQGLTDGFRYVYDLDPGIKFRNCKE